ncbi:MAG: arylesterase [Chromatiaceae bacterium]
MLQLCVLVWVLVLVGCDNGPRLRPLGADAAVLAFGDSLTYGTGAPRGHSYPDVLAELLGRTVINGGVPGELSGQGRERLPAQLDQHEPQLVILIHGGNDLLRKADPAKVVANLRAMIRLTLDRGIDLILIGVPRPGLFVTPPPFYADLAREYGVPYDGEILHAILTDPALKSDTVHPNAAGYRELALAIHRLILEAMRP